MLSVFVLCCNFCACKCACTVGVWSPKGGVADRHLVTIPHGVLGDRLPWGGERHGGGGMWMGTAVLSGRSPFSIPLTPYKALPYGTIRWLRVPIHTNIPRNERAAGLA